jgi:hypothetical protein
MRISTRRLVECVRAFVIDVLTSVNTVNFCERHRAGQPNQVFSADDGINYGIFYDIMSSITPPLPQGTHKSSSTAPISDARWQAVRVGPYNSLRGATNGPITLDERKLAAVGAAPVV